MLELHNLDKSYQNNRVVKNVNLEIGKGEFFCLLGPSGCGKTTILRLIAGFEKCSAGSILLDGKEISSLPPNERDVNTVFQNYALFPNMDIRANISYGLMIKRRSEEEINERVARVISLAGLNGFEKRMPSNLSGGQQQRVALARALVNEPRILLLDEPLSALDKKIAEQTRVELAELQRKVGITFIFVTHNQTEALALADRIAVMNLGVIEQSDTPMNIYEHPKSRFVADFIGSMNLFEGKVKDAGTDYTVVELGDGNEIRFTGRGGMAREQKVTYCIRPERMKISLLDAKEYENSVKGRIYSKSYLGDSTHYLIKLEDGKNIRVIAQNYLLQLDNEFYETGEEVFINWSQTSGELIYALEN